MLTSALIAATIVLLPTGSDPNTTTFTEVDNQWVPSLSPIGTPPLTCWLDNSPVYGGGWYLQVNDSTHTIQWLQMTDEQWDLTLTYPEGK